MQIQADGSLLWVVVIVGSIIAQIIKAKKNAATPPPKSPKRQSGAAGRDFTASSNELQNFLESIGAAKPPAVPQQVARQAQAAKRPTQAVHVRQEVASAPPPLPTHARVEHRPSPLEIRLEQERKFKATQQQQESQSESEVDGISREPSAITRLIKKELQNLDNTRKSIVLREILGPPIALRQT